MLCCKNQAEISNGSISLISSFFTLCTKARVFEQWGLVTWKTHILREMRWSKEFSFTNICRFATWRVEGIFQAIRQRSRDLANMKRRYFNSFTFANWSFNCTEKYQCHSMTKSLRRTHGFHLLSPGRHIPLYVAALTFQPPD